MTNEELISLILDPVPKTDREIMQDKIKELESRIEEMENQNVNMLHTDKDWVAAGNVPIILDLPKDPYGNPA